jgi:integrase
VEALRVLPGRLRSTALPSLRAADVEDAIADVGARAPRQAQLALATLKLALKDARKRGQAFDAAILELRPPRSREREPRFLTWPEVERLASFLPDAEARLVMVAALTGLRQGELFALERGDVDLKQRTIAVRGGKTAAARRAVDLAPLAVKLLKEQTGAISGESPNGKDASRHSDAGSSPAASTLVFPAPSGGPYQPTNFMHRLFRPAVRAAGLDGLTFHDLRHSFASLLVAANVNPKLGAALLGHADGGALFLKRYSHLYPGAGREAADALQRVVVKRTR